MWHLVRKTITKGLHDGADVLNQRETQQEGPSTTGAWIYLGGYLLESYSSTADCGKTHVTAGRATAARRGVGHVQHLDARFSWLQQLWAEGLVHWCLRSSQSGDQRGRPGVEEDRFDFAVERDTLRPSLSSSSWSLRMVAASFSAIEAARDCRVSIWNVRNVCETNGCFWICVRVVIAILTVLSGVPSGISISDDCSQQKETAENAAWRCQMKRARTSCRISKMRTSAWNPDGAGVNCRS